MAHHRLGLSTRARELLERDLVLADARLTADVQARALARHNLGTIATTRADDAVAERHLRAALSWRIALLGDAHYDAIAKRTSLGQCLLHQQRPGDAAEELQRAWDTRAPTPPSMWKGE